MTLLGCHDCDMSRYALPVPSSSAMNAPVLAGSKYGVRQTRGKFGLGAKMVRLVSRVLKRAACSHVHLQALIWSRKSTGMPIEITSACVRASSSFVCLS